MKILVTAPLSTPVPGYEGYGGIQRAIYDIVERLVKTDEVVLFAPQGSQVSPSAQLYTYETKDKQACIEQVERHLAHESYDLIFSHISDEAFTQALLTHSTPLVVACHDYFKPERLQAYAGFDCWLQAQSAAQAAYLKQYVSKVIAAKQSVPIDNVVPSLTCLTESVAAEPRLPILQKLKQQGRDYMLIVSRISNYKGQDTAIKLAKATNFPMIIAGTPILAAEGDFEYFEKIIEPQFNDDNVLYFGGANEMDKQELMRYAKATLLPTGFENRDWHEAFGRVVNESLACGTPVVAHDWDAMPEQIEHGVNGFLFTTFEEAVDDIRRIDEIDRQACIDSTITDLNADRFVRDLRAELIRLVEA